ncbi:MAG: N-acetylmuramoyl-L-alanine amidase [Lysobacterales bacterium]
MDAINPHLLDYVSALAQRSMEEISLVVIHCTELPDLKTARQYAEVIHYAESETGNAGHFYVDRSGAIDQYVPLDRVAHHVTGYNQHSVGIELVNLGRFPHWLDSRTQRMTEPYPDAQIAALVRLVQWLSQRLPSLRHVAGHESLDLRKVSATDDEALEVSRKMDPGPLFPWPQFLEHIDLTRPPLGLQ